MHLRPLEVRQAIGETRGEEQGEVDAALTRDETLYHAMLEIGTAVHEEQVSEILMADLERERLRHSSRL